MTPKIISSMKKPLTNKNFQKGMAKPTKKPKGKAGQRNFRGGQKTNYKGNY